MVFGRAPRRRIAGLAGLAMALAVGQAWAQSRIETITPEDSSRPLSFQDWCEGIKGFDSARCGEQRAEDQAGFKDSQRQLRAMGIGPRQSLGCDANASVNPNRNWVGDQGCKPVNEPQPDRQPFNAPR